MRWQDPRRVFCLVCLLVLLLCLSSRGVSESAEGTVSLSSFARLQEIQSALLILNARAERLLSDLRQNLTQVSAELENLRQESLLLSSELSTLRLELSGLQTEYRGLQQESVRLRGLWEKAESLSKSLDESLRALERRVKTLRLSLTLWRVISVVALCLGLGFGWYMRETM